MAGGSETLLSQAFGAKNYKRMCILVLNMSYILLILYMFSSILFGFSFYIVKGISVSDGAAKVTSEFLKWNIIAMFPMYLYRAFQDFLMSTGIILPLFIATLIGAILHVG